MQTLRPPRSYLFVPADRLDRIARAADSGADAVIVDLEDAVAPAAKDATRNALEGWLRSTEARPVHLRVNAPSTPWFRQDLGLCMLAPVQGIVLPKAEDAASIATAGAAAPGRALLPLVETAVGLDGVRNLAAVPGVQRLVFGSLDFQVDLGIEGDGDALLFARSQLVLVSRLARLEAPVDGVTTSLDDPRALSDDTARARRLGFGAKLCIHPRQVPAVNAGMSPADIEIDWARRIVAATEASSGAVVAVDGKMVDAPVLLRARGVLRRAGLPA